MLLRVIGLQVKFGLGVWPRAGQPCLHLLRVLPAVAADSIDAPGLHALIGTSRQSI